MPPSGIFLALARLQGWSQTRFERMKTLFRIAGGRLILGSGLLAMTVAGCSDDPVVVDPVVDVQKTGGTDNQQAAAGTVVPRSPEVTLTAASGAAAEGETVTFTVEGGGGSVVGGVVVTDGRGTARVGEWTLGQIATANFLKATANGLEVTFTAIGVAGPAASVVIASGGEQTARVRTEVPIPPEVLVADQFGNGVEGAEVQFQVLSGGGSIIGNSSVFSEADGLAQLGGWQLGFQVGENILEATVQGFPTVQFRATATP